MKKKSKNCEFFGCRKKYKFIATEIYKTASGVFYDAFTLKVCKEHLPKNLDPIIFEQFEGTLSSLLSKPDVPDIYKSSLWNPCRQHIVKKYA